MSNCASASLYSNSAPRSLPGREGMNNTKEKTKNVFARMLSALAEAFRWLFCCIFPKHDQQANRGMMYTHAGNGEECSDENAADLIYL